jgi:hypothetical protein
MPATKPAPGSSPLRAYCTRNCFPWPVLDAVHWHETPGLTSEIHSPFDNIIAQTIWEASDAAYGRHKISRSSSHSGGVPDLRTKRRARPASPDLRRPRCSKRHRLDRFGEAPGRQPAIMAAEAPTNNAHVPRDSRARHRYNNQENVGNFGTAITEC